MAAVAAHEPPAVAVAEPQAELPQYSDQPTLLDQYSD
jgi:hypothetical protein